MAVAAAAASADGAALEGMEACRSGGASRRLACHVTNRRTMHGEAGQRRGRCAALQHAGNTSCSLRWLGRPAGRFQHRKKGTRGAWLEMGGLGGLGAGS